MCHSRLPGILMLDFAGSWLRALYKTRGTYTIYLISRGLSFRQTFEVLKNLLA